MLKTRSLFLAFMICLFVFASLTLAQDEAADGVTEAQELVTALEAPVTFIAPGEPLQVGDALEGKTVYFVANGLNFPFVQNVLAGVQQAADLVGMNVIAVDGAGESAKAAGLVEQGIAQGVDAIILQSFPAEQLVESVQAAQEAGIPVLEMFGRDPQLPSEELSEIGVSAITSFCYGCAGQQMAQFVVADSGGDANVVLFDVPEIGVSALERDGFVSELARLCADCTVTVVEAPLAQWNQQLPSLTASVLQNDATVNYLVPLFDSMIALMKPSVFAAGAEESVKFVSYNGTLPALQDLANEELVVADVGGMNRWVGWAGMDQIVRLLTGSDPVEDTMIPNRIFTANNIGELDLEADETVWYGEVDLAAEYGALWGVTEAE